NIILSLGVFWVVKKMLANVIQILFKSSFHGDKTFARRVGIFAQLGVTSSIQETGHTEIIILGVFICGNLLVGCQFDIFVINFDILYRKSRMLLFFLVLKWKILIKLKSLKS